MNTPIRMVRAGIRIKNKLIKKESPEFCIDYNKG
jgi:hypothetical protein